MGTRALNAQPPPVFSTSRCRDSQDDGSGWHCGLNGLLYFCIYSMHVQANSNHRTLGLHACVLSETNLYQTLGKHSDRDT